MHSPFSLSWLRQPRRKGYGSSSDSRALFRLRSSWRFKLPGPDFTNRFINPFIMFAFHRSLKIRIIRPGNRTAFPWLEVLSAIFTLLNVHTCDVKVTWSKSKRLWRMTHEATFRTVFPSKKGTKRHSKHLVSRHLDGIPKKWLVSRQLPIKPGSQRI